MPNTCCPEFVMYCCADGFPLFATKFLLLLLVAIFKLAMYAFLYSGVFILCIMNIMIMNSFIFFIGAFQIRKCLKIFCSTQPLERVEPKPPFGRGAYGGLPP